MFLHYKMFFFLILIVGSLISISSNSWMGMWLGLEINLLAFIPLIQQKNHPFSTESSLKYLLTQALASMILLFTMIFMAKNFLIMKNIENFIMIMFNSSLLTKMGMAPFHYWFPEVIEGMNWINCMILLTWQKITPMVLIMYNMNFQNFFIFIIIFSMLISGLMGLNQSSLRKILAYSSINHMAWMISSMYFSETIWFYYMITYFILTFNITLIFKFLNIYFFNQLIISLNKNFLMKFFFCFNFLSLGGLPPFLGFYPKWLITQYLITLNYILLVFIMILLTLLTLFYYLRLIFSIMMFNNNEVNFFYKINFKNSMLIYFNSISLLSLMFLTYFINFL